MSSHSDLGSSSGSASAPSNAPSSVTSISASDPTSAAGGGGVKGSDHPEDVWYGILALLALATLANACYLAWVTHRRHGARRGSLRPSRSRSPNDIRRLSLRRIPQAMLSVSRIFSFRIRIPFLELNMAEFMFGVAYMTACLVWCYAPHDGHAYPNNLEYKTWANRTGKLATIQLPFIVLLSMKNNTITWLTGIGHEKLNALHRVVARCVLLLTWLHVVGIYYHAPQKLLTANWKIAGLVGAVTQTLTTIISVKWVRRRFYESFYVSHVVLVLISLVCIHIHVAPKNCDKYIWGVWAIWIFDRLFRAGRYLLFNFISRPSNSRARAEVIGAGGLRVTLRRKIPGGWRAGQHVFLAFPSLGFESHPFTIGNVYQKDEKTGEAEMVFTIRAMDGQTRKLLNLALPTGVFELPAMVDGPYGHPQDVRPFSTCVFIAGGTGVTYTLGRMHQLFRDIHAADACAQRVLFVWAVRTEIEYEWIAADLARILSQAPSTISVAVDVYLTNTADTLRSLPMSEKEYDVDVVEKGGAISETSCDSSESHSDEKACPSPSPASPCSSSCTITKPEGAYFHFSSGTATPTTPTACSSTGGALPLPALSESQPAGNAGVRVRKRYGRPDVYRILEEEVTASHGAVAVDVSGPDGIVDAVRSALCAPFAGPVAALRGTPTVMLSVEQFRM